jgi:hypothetical protein
VSGLSIRLSFWLSIPDMPATHQDIPAAKKILS